MTLYPIILSGGSGTRLWPLSRAMYPKQFIDLLPGQPPMLIQAIERLNGEAFAPPTIICNTDHRFLVQDALADASLAAGAIMLEPTARNTAPAIAATAIAIAAKDPDGVLVVMPSDHVIGDADGFRDAVQRASAVAASGRLVLFGIKPSEPHTGYGYIETGSAVAGFDGFHDVARFVEKPDAATAERYLASGRHLWNSGIFVLHAATFLNELEALAPELFATAGDAVESGRTDGQFFRLDAEAFAACPSISVDYAVMEQTDKAAVLPVDLAWSDVGSWGALWDVATKDADGNAISGDVVPVDSTGNYIRSESGLVTTIGISDLVVVSTKDAVLVAPKSRAQDVSGLVRSLRDKGRNEHAQHVRSNRPWGHFETLALGPRFQVKRLHVRPGGKLSMQRHHHRSEHWIVVQGTAKVTIGDMQKLVTENESVYIFATQWHRLENPGKVPLEIIEVQTGTYFGEDDIERSDDVYNRAPDETR
jgi:mannose-1-phosphate guanylyltransferase/mannose-6-phosphate isomerase